LRLVGTDAGSIEGIDWKQWHGEQFACSRDVGGTRRAGEQELIADAMEACG
jgi:hypothetical protein